MPIITLTTDFGTADGYVGAMKGVISRLCDRATIVDLAHDIPRHDVAHAAWVVATACAEFPPDTIHVVVVDPGVGGARRGVIAKSSGQVFVGPDNGVFAYVANEQSPAWEIRFPRFMARRVSPTFHGRDIFAPTAALLAQGEPAGLAGPRATLRGELPWGPRIVGVGRVVHIDRYGNLVSDLPADEAGAAVRIADKTLAVVATYEDAPIGAVLAYVGSAGTIEIAIREGDAGAMLGVERGTLVEPAIAPPTLGPYR